MDKGYFVDWNGDTRRVDAPGTGYECQVVRRPGGYLGVDVADEAGFVCHESPFYATIASLEAVGVVVNLV